MISFSVQRIKTDPFLSLDWKVFNNTQTRQRFFSNASVGSFPTSQIQLNGFICTQSADVKLSRAPPTKGRFQSCTVAKSWPGVLCPLAWPWSKWVFSIDLRQLGCWRDPARLCDGSNGDSLSVSGCNPGSGSAESQMFHRSDNTSLPRGNVNFLLFSSFVSSW